MEDRRKIDLHVHMTASDGSKSPEELLTYCISKQISAIAITEHDTLDGIKNARKYDSSEIELISGAEISAQGNREIHILGYFIDVYSAKMKFAFSDIKRARHRASLYLLRKLKENKIEINLQELMKRGYSVDGFGITKLMIEKGYVDNIAEAREEYFNEGKPLYIEKKRMKKNI